MRVEDRHRVSALIAGTAFAVVLGGAAAAQNRTIRGTVSQTVTATSANGLLASCAASRIEADKGDCSKLKAYLDARGSDDMCIDWWRQAIDLDREIARLSSPATENTNRNVSARQGQLSRQLAALESQIDQRCRTPQVADEFASGGNPRTQRTGPPPPPDEFAADAPPEFWRWDPPLRWPPLPGWGWPPPQRLPGTIRGNPGTPQRQPDPRTARASRGCDDPIVRTSQDLARLIFVGYQTNPILIAAVKNQPDTYLVALSGLDRGSSQIPGGTLVLVTASLGSADVYSDSVIENLRETIGAGRATIILAGHSLGGMVAEKLASDWNGGASINRRAQRVVTFGSPIPLRLAMAGIPGTGTAAYSVGRFAVTGDPVVLGVPLLGRTTFAPVGPDSNLYTWVDGGANPDLHMAYPESQKLTQFDALGGRTGAMLVLDCTRAWRRAATLPRPDTQVYPTTPTPEMRGMTPTQDRLLKQTAQSRGVILIVRDSNPLAVKWMNVSTKPTDPIIYAPKPMWLKDKTLKPPRFGDVPSPLGDCTNPQVYGLVGLSLRTGQTIEQASVEYANVGVHVGSRADCYVLGLLVPGHPELETRYFSDTDLHGVYTKEGVDAWTANLIPSLNERLVNNRLPSMIQHPPQDNWSDRNKKTVQINGHTMANGNYGPQPPATAYLPDGTAVHLPDVCWLKQFYLQHNIPYTRVYPYPDEQGPVVRSILSTSPCS